MKEKLSCSLDGDMVAFMDDFIEQFPMVSSRSAVIEMALIAFIGAVIDIDESGKRWDIDAIHMLLEGRAALNAKKESKNRNL